MPAVIGPLAMKALERIQSTLGLDYAGIDFGLNAKGEVLVFEANATMVVNPPDPGERWSYRLPAYERIRSAVQKMLVERAGRGQKGRDTVNARSTLPTPHPFATGQTAASSL
jgi:hypothetical protein